MVLCHSYSIMLAGASNMIQVMFNIFNHRFIIGFFFSLMSIVSWPICAETNGIMVGEITRADLQENTTTKKWLDKNYLRYSPNTQIVNQSQALLVDVSITVFLGTWCHDSQREVPALLKILDTISFNAENLSIIALSVSKDTPSKREDKAHISRTPTFIFYRNGREIGRYVEQAKKSLEQDILDIISGVDYRHYYADSSNLKNAH